MTARVSPATSRKTDERCNRRLVDRGDLVDSLSLSSRLATASRLLPPRSGLSLKFAGTSVRNRSKFRHQTVVGGATVAHVRRPLPRKAAVAADMVWCLRLTDSGPLTARQVASFRANN